MGPASRAPFLDELSLPPVMLLAWLPGKKVNPGAIVGGALIAAGAIVMAPARNLYWFK